MCLHNVTITENDLIMHSESEEESGSSSHVCDKSDCICECTEEIKSD